MSEAASLSAHDVQTLLYDEASAPLRRAIASLVDVAYGSTDAEPDDDTKPLHAADLHARSFFICVDGRVVSYAGVITKTIQHTDQTFTIAGLSSVATDPAHQRQGLAMRTVAAATRHIEQSGVDIGVFTCAPALVPLYAAAGSWTIAPDVVLIGNSAPGALSSAALDVVVLMRLLSDKARGAAGSLLHGTIDLDLPMGEFL